MMLAWHTALGNLAARGSRGSLRQVEQRILRAAREDLSAYVPHCVFLAYSPSVISGCVGFDAMAIDTFISVDLTYAPLREQLAWWEGPRKLTRSGRPCGLRPP